jgi:hypothetical protein
MGALQKASGWLWEHKILKTLPPGFDNASTIKRKSMQHFNSVIFLLHHGSDHATFLPVRIYGSLSCDRLSWHFLQNFACQSAKALAAHTVTLYSVIAL